MKIVIVLAALLLPGTAASQTEPEPEPVPSPSPFAANLRHIPPPRSPDDAQGFMGQDQMPNALSVGGPTCPSIRHQIEAEKGRLRDDDARRLDREPRAFLFHAVDRTVDGCREVTFIGRPRD